MKCKLIIHLDFHYDSDKGVYVLDYPLKYLSPRYNKSTTCEAGFESDGASGPAEDVVSAAWFIHDKLCRTHRFDDGSACSAWQASAILHDILMEEGRYIRAKTWFVATYLWTVWTW